MARKRSTGGKRAGRKIRTKSKCPVKNAQFKAVLTKLKSMKGPQRVQALRMVNGKFIRELCKHTRTLRNAKLSPALSKNLRRHGKQLRKLLHKKSSINVRRKLLTQQRGGFLAPLLTAIIPSLVGGLASKLFQR